MTNVTAVIAPDNATNISAAGTTLVQTGSGVLVRIVVNKAVALSVTTVYDSITAAGAKLATITNPLALLQSQTPLEYNCRFDNGLTVVTSLGDDITVIWR